MNKIIKRGISFSGIKIYPCIKKSDTQATV